MYVLEEKTDVINQESESEAGVLLVDLFDGLTDQLEKSDGKSVSRRIQSDNRMWLWGIGWNLT